METDNGPFISDKVMLAIGGINFSPPCSPRTERKRIDLVRPSLSLENTRQVTAFINMCNQLNVLHRTMNLFSIFQIIFSSNLI